MPAEYIIQILDEDNENVVFFDRIKTSYGLHRIITSTTYGKRYSSRQAAEADAKLVEQYYPGRHLIEIVDNSSVTFKSEESITNDN